MPACLALGEATWVTLLVNASYNATHGPRVELPFVAFAAPAVGAVTVVAATLRLRWTWWQRAALVAAVATVGAAVTAGCIAALTDPGSAWRVATEPWTSQAHRVATVAGAAWLVAIAAWARGTWLAAAKPTFAHAVRSAAISATAFVGIFAGRAAGRDAAFRAVTGDTGVLLFVFLPLTGAALLLIRQQELERDVLLRTSSGPGLAWLGVLGAPLLVIGGACVVAAAVARPAARGIGRAGLAVARAIGWLFAALGRLFAGGNGQGVQTIHPVIGAHPLPAPVAPPVAHHAWTVPGPVWAVLGAVATALAVWAVARYAGPIWPRRWRPARAPDVDEERDSVFTWSHFGAQVARALRRLVRRLLALLWPFRRRRVSLDGAPQATAAHPYGGGGTGLEGIRREYRRVLVAARRAEKPRAPAETASEFERRLAGDLTDDGAAALGDLTGLYELVRYGDATLTEPERERGRREAGEIVDALQAAPAPE